MKIYTKKGDKGTTGLFGGKRVDKDSTRIEVLGTWDELNSTIGLMRTKLGDTHEWQSNLHRIQKDMMNMMSHLARPSDSHKENKNPEPKDGAEFCEIWIDEMEEKMSSPSDYFLLPGGNEISAMCHVCRTQTRRAERILVTLYKEDPESVFDYISVYINRMSDLFFTMARYEMDKHGVAEEKWNLFLYKKKPSKLKK